MTLSADAFPMLAGGYTRLSKHPSIAVRKVILVFAYLRLTTSALLCVWNISLH